MVHQTKAEIIIPIYYNDGTKIESVKHVYTYREIITQFNHCTEDKSLLVGDWTDDAGKQYKDRNFAYFVLYNDSYDNIYFLDELKKRLEDRYQQYEILIYLTNVTRL